MGKNKKKKNDYDDDEEVEIKYSYVYPEARSRNIRIYNICRLKVSSTVFLFDTLNRNRLLFFHFAVTYYLCTYVYIHIYI